jgi:diadenylate cyclase
MTFLIPRFYNIVDIIIIAFLIYQILLFIRRAGNYQILYGILVIIVIYITTSFLKLEMTSWILGSIKNLWILIVVILFQQEIRDLLYKISLSPKFERKSRKAMNRDITSILIDAVSAMAFRRIGALIVIEKKNRLNDLINSGEIIDSLISLRLILAIFNQKSVLHDGAIIVRNDRILAAKAVLPLTKNIGHKTKFGTRHLAAIGITEVSDALAIVVSEQTGRISIAVSGAIQTDVAFEELMQIITDASR